MARCINNGEVVLWGLELPEADINGGATLATSLEPVHDPSIPQVTLVGIGTVLMRFIENSLADSSTLGDEVTTQSGLAGINVADHNDADVGLVPFHWDVVRGVK